MKLALDAQSSPFSSPRAVQKWKLLSQNLGLQECSHNDDGVADPSRSSLQKDLANFLLPICSPARRAAMKWKSKGNPLVQPASELSPSKQPLDGKALTIESLKVLLKEKKRAVSDLQTELQSLDQFEIPSKDSHSAPSLLSKVPSFTVVKANAARPLARTLPFVQARISELEKKSSSMHEAHEAFCDQLKKFRCLKLESMINQVLEEHQRIVSEVDPLCQNQLVDCFNEINSFIESIGAQNMNKIQAEYNNEYTQFSAEAREKSAHCAMECSSAIRKEFSIFLETMEKNIQTETFTALKQEILQDREWTRNVRDEVYQELKDELTNALRAEHEEQCAAEVSEKMHSLEVHEREVLEKIVKNDDLEIHSTLIHPEEEALRRITITFEDMRRQCSDLRRQQTVHQENFARLRADITELKKNRHHLRREYRKKILTEQLIASELAKELSDTQKRCLGHNPQSC